MIDRLREQVDRQEEQFDDHLRRIGHLEVEERRTRERLHRLEGDRRAIGMLVETTRALARQTEELARKVSAGVDQAEAVAEAAAEKAVEKAFARRAESRWRLAGRVATYLAAIGSFGYLIATLILR